MNATNIKALFSTVWQEDNEIEFVDLALSGIPADMKDANGVPSANGFVGDYLRRLYQANSGLIVRLASERFLSLFD